MKVWPRTSIDIQIENRFVGIRAPNIFFSMRQLQKGLNSTYYGTNSVKIISDLLIGNISTCLFSSNLKSAEIYSGAIDSFILACGQCTDNAEQKHDTVEARDTN